VRTDRYTRSARTFYNLNRWVGIRIDILGALFSSALAAYLVYRPRHGHQEGYAAETGFSLNMAGTSTTHSCSTYVLNMYRSWF
jgi:hypothetical protein